MLYSIIIPVYNRPEEVKELLDSLTRQTYPQETLSFEVLIVEDGSAVKCEEVVKLFENQLDIKYFYKPNEGQGFARNYGFERAKGDFLLVFDSDCILPPQYLMEVDKGLKNKQLDAFGGPDKAHPDFTPVQKAISYAMTSLFSTGGIRGGKKSAEKFRPRSFNMGFSRKVYEEVGGYKITRMGEDIEFSIRVERNHFKVGLIPNAFVYHKRRTNFRQFYKQLHFFGRARINIRRFYPNELKLVHTFPALFVLFLAGFFVTPFISLTLFYTQVLFFLLYLSLVFSDALAKTKNLWVSILGVWAVLVQLTAYGMGFLTEIFFPLSQQGIDQHKN
jgi:glycosyltransferase involved in cell wall biosynthesis